MFLYRVRLFSLFGFAVSVDASWLVLAALVASSLAVSVFPETFPGFAATTYWVMGTATALGLLGSIIFHETAHALVARRFGIPIGGITLFIFGGVAEMQQEPDSARAELLMAGAGPLASLALGAALWLAAAATSGPASATLGYLGLINLALAVFNLVPAFPLDGGRMLRALLWLWRRDQLQATRIAAVLGRGFGLLLVMFGLLRVLAGDVVGGVWSFLIGLFLHSAAIGSYRQTLAARLLAGVTVAQIMHAEPLTVAAEISVATFVARYIYPHHAEWFPVVQGRDLLGTVGAREAASVDRRLWSGIPLARILKPLSPATTIAPETDALTALRRMRTSGEDRLLVLRDNELIGTLGLRDVLDVLALREQLALS